ncbi:MAG: hypothetical protein KF906_02315 [Actinobacteria bacterium]|nr:hypothetical protein [Actinomycetota bacterium]
MNGTDVRTAARRGPRAWLVVLGIVGLLAGCGVDGGSSDATADEPDGTTTTTEALDEGAIVGDPGSIRAFDDPSTEITDAQDLTDYLLPGFSGPGVDCVVGDLDVAEVLDNSREDGGWTAARVVVGCVDITHFGKIVAMYATAVDPDSEIAYEDIEACVAREYSEDEGANTYKLATVYEARLDLEGPVTSPGVARDEIGLTTGCLADFEDDDTTATTATTLPKRTTTTTEPATTETTLAPGSRQTTWAFVTAGSCVLALPAANASQTTLTPCSAPHGGEVMSAGLGAAPTADHCQKVAETYLGDTQPPWTADIVTVQRTELSNVVRTVCIIGPADDSKVTGSVKG